MPVIESSHENLPAIEDPYANSTIIEKLKRRQEERLPLRIAYLDIDSTLTGNDPNERIAARALFDQLGYVTVFVTSRTEEMLMSEKEFEASKKFGLQRDAPKLEIKDHDSPRTLAFADEVEGFEGLYDPDVIASTTGTRILVHQKTGGYMEDPDFREMMKDGPDEWREKTEEVLRLVDPEGTLFKLSPVDIENNFENGKTDVAPPDFRIQLMFEPSHVDSVIESTGSTQVGIELTPAEKAEELSKKFKLRERLNSLRKDPATPLHIKTQIQNIRITDDSNPEIGKFSVYLTPKKGYKARAVDCVAASLAKELSIGKEELDILYVGDSWPDVAAGLYGAVRMETDSGNGQRKFLIVGNSRLTEPFTSVDDDNFAGEKLKFLKRRLKKKRSGVYDFRIWPVGRCEVIIGDIVYPGTREVGTVKAFLEDQVNNIAR